MSELGLSIKIGAVVGGALAALGSVQGHMERMGTATVALRARQKRLNQVIERFASATTSARLGRLQMQYDRVGAAIKRVERAQERLNRVAQRGAYLRQQRQNLQGEVLNTLAIGAVVAAPIKLAVDFESAMADVKKSG